FADYGAIYLRRACLPESCDRIGGQGSAVEEMLSDAIGEGKAVLSVADEVGLQIVRAYTDLVRDPLHRSFAVPAYIFEPCPGLAQADGLPGLQRVPIPVGPVQLKDYVVNVLGHIQVLPDLSILGEGGQVGVVEGEHGIARDRVPVHQ